MIPRKAGIPNAQAGQGNLTGLFLVFRSVENRNRGEENWGDAPETARKTSLHASSPGEPNCEGGVVWPFRENSPDVDYSMQIPAGPAYTAFTRKLIKLLLLLLLPHAFRDIGKLPRMAAFVTG